MNLVTVTVPVEHNDGIANLPALCEQVAPGLALAPSITDGRLDGRFTLVHVQSGQQLHQHGKACASCVRFFVLSMPLFDWDQPAEDIEGSAEAFHLAELFAEACERCKVACVPAETPLFDLPEGP